MKNIFIILALVFCSLQVRGQIFLSEIQDTVGKGYVPITDYDPALATYIQKYMLLQDYLEDSISWASVPVGLHDAVTLAGSYDYITLSGQVITRNQIDLTTDVTGLLPYTSLSGAPTLLSQFTDDLGHIEESTTVTDLANGLDISLSTYDISVSPDFVELTTETTIDGTDYIIIHDATTPNDGKITYSNFVSGDWTGTLDGLEGAAYLDNTDDQTLSLVTNTLSIEDGNSVSLAPYLDNTDNQTLSFASPNLSISGGNSVDISAIDTDTQLSQEQVEDYVGGMVTGNTETRIAVTYQDIDGTLDFVVEDDLSLYDNTTSGFLTAEVDGSTTNELQTISTTGAAGNITLSNGGGTLNLNVDDADASSSNEYNTSVALVGNDLQVTDGGGTLSTSLAVYLDNTDSQGFDVSQLVGTDLQLSLDNDGEATKIIDLSSLDNSGTDDQTLQEVLTSGNDAGGLDAMNFAEVEADEFIGDLRGAVLFKAQAGETLAKGEVVYVSGISGNTTIVSKADADDAAKMPAFGVVAVAANSGNPVDIYTFGTLSNLNTSGFTLGDILYVSTTAGQLTATPPTGESALIQNIAKVTRVDNAAGSIKISGAGRTNATPNLNTGRLFVGNASNQAVADGTMYVDIANSEVGIGTSSPSEKLDVNGTARFGSQVSIGNVPTTSAADLYLYSTSNTNIRLADGSTYFDLYHNDGGSGTSVTLLDIDPTGTSSGTNEFRIDIDNTREVTLTPSGMGLNGVTSPSATLDVNGDVEIATVNTDNTTDDVLVHSSDGTVSKRTLTSIGDEIDLNLGDDNLTLTGFRTVNLSNNDLAFWMNGVGSGGAWRFDASTNGFDNVSDYGYFSMTNPSSGFDLIERFNFFGGDGTSNYNIRIFDQTSTTGAKEVRIYNGALRLYDSGSASDIYLNPDGNSYIVNRLGIGTNSPQTKLHIDGVTTMFPEYLIQSGITSTTQEGYLQFETNSSINDNYWLWTAATSGNNSNRTWKSGMLTHTNNAYGGHDVRLAIFNQPNSTASKSVEPDPDNDVVMTWAQDGKVGIGTSSPSVKLEVSKDAPIIRLNDTDTALSDDEISSKIEFYQNDSFGAGVSSYFMADGSGSTGLHHMKYFSAVHTFSTGTVAGVNVDPALHIAYNGNVGIGTSPSSKLHISDATPELRIQSTGVGALGNPRITLYDNTSTLGQIGYLSTSNSDLDIFQSANASIDFWTNSTFAMTIDETQNVGIGTNPQEQLHILNTGNVYTEVESTDDGQAGIKLTSGANTWNLWHDSSLTRLNFNSPSGVVGVWKDDGRLGIGITLPSRKLTVKDDSDWRVAYFESTYLSGTNRYSSIVVGSAQGSGQSAQFGFIDNILDRNLSYAHITPYGAGEGNSFRVYRNGNIVLNPVVGFTGIGTNSPDQLLHADKNQNADTRIKISNTSTGTSARSGVGLWNGTGGGDNAFFHVTGQNYSGLPGWDDRFVVQTGSTISNGILFYASSGGITFSNSTTNSPDLYVSDGGNVGIGTSSPSEKLDVDGNVRIDGDIGFNIAPVTNKNISVYEASVDVQLLLQTGDATKGSWIDYKNPDITYRLGVESSDEFVAREVGGDLIFKITESAGTYDARFNSTMRVDNITQNDALGKLLAWDTSDNKFYWRDVSTIGGGNGIFDASNDGGTVPTSMDIEITDNINFKLSPSSASVLYLNASLTRVGINQPSPSYTLDVNGSGNFASILEVGTSVEAGSGYYHQEGGDLHTGISFPVGDEVTINAGGVEFISAAETTQNLLHINQANADIDLRVGSQSLSHALFIRGSDGKVGINKSSPSAQLDVVGTTELNGTVKMSGELQHIGDTDTKIGFGDGLNNIDFTAGGVLGLRFESGLSSFNIGGANHDFRIDGQTVDNILRVDASAENIGFNGINATSEFFYVNGSSRFTDNVGIGDSPSARLDVVGTTELNGDLEVNGEVTWSERALGRIHKTSTTTVTTTAAEITGYDSGTGIGLEIGDVTLDETNGRITVTNAGYYRIDINATMVGLSSSTTGELRLRVDGSTIAEWKADELFFDNGLDELTLSASFVLELSAGQYVSLWGDRFLGSDNMEVDYVSLGVERLIGY